MADACRIVVKLGRIKELSINHSFLLLSLRRPATLRMVSCQ